MLAVQPSMVRRILKALGSLRLAVALMGTIAAASIAGTLVRKESYDVYRARWFLGLLALLALNTAACMFSRARLRLHVLGSLSVHAGVLFIAAGVIGRSLFGVSGMVLIEEGRCVDSFQTTDAAVPLGFQLRLDEFKIAYHDNEAHLLEVDTGEDGGPRVFPAEVGKALRIKPDGTTVTVLEKLSRLIQYENRQFSPSSVRLNPAIHVQLRGPAGESARWMFARPPEPHDDWEPFGVRMRYRWHPPTVKSFESRVTILDGDGEVLQEESIRVNKPLKVGRYTFHQSDYRLTPGLTSVLGVSRDPGLPLVLIGFVLLPAGIAFSFYVKPLLRREGYQHE